MKNLISVCLCLALCLGLTVPALALGQAADLSRADAAAYYQVLNSQVQRYGVAPSTTEYTYSSPSFGAGLIYAGLQDFNGDGVLDLFTLRVSDPISGSARAEFWTIRSGAAVQTGSGEVQAAFTNCSEGGIRLIHRGNETRLCGFSSGFDPNMSADPIDGEIPGTDWEGVNTLDMQGSWTEYWYSSDRADNSQWTAWTSSGWTEGETLVQGEDYGYVVLMYDAQAAAGVTQLRDSLQRRASETQAIPYTDVLSSLPSGDRTSLFSKFLGYVLYGAGNLDCQTASDGALMQALVSMWDISSQTFGTVPGAPAGQVLDQMYQGFYYIYEFSLTDFNRLTQQFFGRTVDVTAFSGQTSGRDYYYLPASGTVRLLASCGGGEFPKLVSVTPQHLYQLTDTRYYAQLQSTWNTAGELSTRTNMAVVDRNADGTWTLVRLYEDAGPDADELAAYAVSTVGGFTDVHTGDYYANPVLWAVEHGVTAGTTPTTFSPQETCTTAQILTFLWRAAGSTPPKGGNPFSDVTQNDYYRDAAVWAYEQGLVSGGTLNGDAPCTRATTMTYLWKLTGSPAAGASGFSDVPSGASYAQAVAWAVKNGITAGTGDGKFSPDETCTRGQIMTFLYLDFGAN